jgi:hypothetical protein
MSMRCRLSSITTASSWRTIRSPTLIRPVLCTVGRRVAVVLFIQHDGRATGVYLSPTSGVMRNGLSIASVLVSVDATS